MTRQLLLPIIVGAIASTNLATGMVLREPVPKAAVNPISDNAKAEVAATGVEYGEWSPSSWRTKEAKQIPEYPDPEHLKEVEEKLSKSAPLVFAGEVRTLSDQLALASQGKAFVLFEHYKTILNQLELTHQVNGLVVVVVVLVLLVFNNMPVLIDCPEK